MAFNFLSKGSLKGDKVGGRNKFSANISIGGVLRIVARFFQLVMGLTIIGLYAVDLDRAHKAGVYYDSKWMYATIVGAISSLVAIIFMLPLVKAWFFFYIDTVIFILYLTAFGIFGKMYIKEDPEGNTGIIRMKRAVWIQLVNMLLWFGTAAYGATIFWKERKARTLFSGRAPSHV